MAFATKLLAVGEVDDTPSALYTVPSSTVAYIKKVKLYNTDVVQQTVVTYIERSGTSREYERVVLDIGESADLFEEISLEAADILKAESTDNGVVTFHVHGVEET